jgi:hypothetical protein
LGIGDRQRPLGLELTWNANGEGDLAGYAIYRGTSADFVPGPGTLVTSTADTLYLDGSWSWDGGYYYKVAAVDVHGNKSAYAVLGPDNVTGDETPRTPAATRLAQNFPNPFNPSTRIAFDLEAPATVHLRVYDAAGRLVRSLVDEAMPAGRYVKTWDGRDGAGRQVASGIYFYRQDGAHALAARLGSLFLRRGRGLGGLLGLAPVYQAEREPADDESAHEGEEHEQGPGHEEVPEEEFHLDDVHVLGDEDGEKTGNDKDQDDLHVGHDSLPCDFRRFRLRLYQFRFCGNSLYRRQVPAGRRGALEAPDRGNALDRRK